MSSPRLTFSGFWPAMNEYPRYLCDCWISSLNINAWIPVWVLLFPGALHTLVIKDEILSITVTAASIDPKCQSQDQSPLVWPTTQRTNKTIILLQTANSLFIREEMASGCKSTDWGMLRNREFGQHDRSAAVSVSQVPFLWWFVWRHHSCPCWELRDCWGGEVVCVTHRIKYWGFLWTKLLFYLLFWNTPCC